jgi:hypothetical protein
MFAASSSISATPLIFVIKKLKCLQMKNNCPLNLSCIAKARVPIRGQPKKSFMQNLKINQKLGAK